ncbi:MAG: hypothetical protein WC029_06565 [Sulfuricella sp.]
MNPDKAVNHGVHGEHGVETIDYMMFGIHPLDEVINDRKQHFFVFSVPSVVIELRLLG